MFRRCIYVYRIRLEAKMQSLNLCTFRVGFCYFHIPTNAIIIIRLYQHLRQSLVDANTKAAHINARCSISMTDLHSGVFISMRTYFQDRIYTMPNANKQYLPVVFYFIHYLFSLLPFQPNENFHFRMPTQAIPFAHNVAIFTRFTRSSANVNIIYRKLQCWYNNHP